MTMYRFWSMVAHYHGQVWNAAEPARSLGIGETTVRRYLDLLCDLFMVRFLPAWHADLKKRQVKSPKVYFRDSGLLHHMLGIRDEGQLLRHPKCGASWEGYVVEEVLRAIEPDAAHFWDNLFQKPGRLSLFTGKARSLICWPPFLGGRIS